MDKAKIFVIMPFKDEYFELYEIIKNKFQDNFEIAHASSEDNPQNILSDIIQPIYDSDIILADLTGLNPNVMYELGIAHTLNKKTIIITKDDLDTLPFDLKQYRAKNYNMHFKKFSELLECLEKYFNGALDGSVIFSNPVNDFLKINGLEKVSPEIQKQEIAATEEYGYLDYKAEIEDDTRSLTINLKNMSANMSTMTNGILNCSAEIEQAKKSGIATAVFMRMKANKIAEYISTFSNQLKEHNKINETLWIKIEKNLLGLLENNYAIQPNNIDDLKKYLKSLLHIKSSLIKNNEASNSLKITNGQVIGLQKSMTQSVKFLNEDLTTYMNINSQMIAGIDKIIAKSKFVVGEIE